MSATVSASIFLPVSISDDAMQGEDAKVLDYLRRLCSVREYCRRDIREKALRRFDGDASRADAAVETLVDEGFLDEARYACAFCRDKSSIRGWGPVKIRSALYSKGIPADVIAAALGEIDSSKADSKLKKALQVKKNQLGRDPQLRLKLLRFALGRGYDYETASSALSSILSDD